MPEGDTLHRAARTMHRALAGRVVTRFESVYPKLTRVDEDAPIAGRTVESVTANGKHLLVRFAGGLVLRTHMRMSGSWHLYRPGEAWQEPRSEARIRFDTDAFVAVAFRVPVAEFLDDRALPRQRDLRAIGPDLLGETVDVAEGVRRLRADGARTIEVALLDQRSVAGIGNVFKSEVLFLGGVHPLAAAAALPDATLERLLAIARAAMQANVRTGSDAGIVTYTGFRRTTRRADPMERLWVYGRKGRPCRKCGTPIVRQVTGPHARPTYWCPTCQEEGAPGA